MADALTWMINATFFPPPVHINSIKPLPAGGVSIGFAAQANLDYLLQYRNDLVIPASAWATLKEFGSSPADRPLLSTNPFGPSPARFFRLWVKP